MSETVSGELEQKILHYLGTVSMVKVRSVAKAIGEDKKLADQAIGKLAREDKIEYLYLDTSYIKLKGK